MPPCSSRTFEAAQCYEKQEQTITYKDDLQTFGRSRHCSVASLLALDVMDSVPTHRSVKQLDRFDTSWRADQDIPPADSPGQGRAGASSAPAPSRSSEIANVHHCGKCGAGIDGRRWFMAGNRKHCSVECSTRTALRLELEDPALREGASAADLVAAIAEEDE